jgi:hypothetical protein
MFDEFGNYIGGSLSRGYSPSAFITPYFGPTTTLGNVLSTDTGLGGAPMQALPTLPGNFAASYNNPLLTAQQRAAYGMNPNYGRSYTAQPAAAPTPAVSGATFGSYFPNPLQQNQANRFSLRQPTSTTKNTPNFTQNPNIQITQEGPSSMGPGNMVDTAAKTALGAAAGLNPYIAAGTLGLGAIQTIGGLIGLATTKEPKGYELTPKLKSAIGEAETAARFGLGAPQLALARQQGREAINTQMYNARNLSPNMASILGRMNVGTSLSAANQLAAQDFAAQEQKRKYRDAMYAQEQEIADRNVALAQQRYQQKQAAYGGAMQSGLTNLGSYFNLAAALNYTPTA